MIRTYAYDIASIIRITGMPKDHMDWADRIEESAKAILFNPVKFQHWYEQLKKTEPNATLEEAQAYVFNSCVQMGWEATALYNKVVLHVEDAQFIEALLRSDVDAVIGDVRMPFPIIEFTFPGGIELSPGYELSGSLLIDARNFPFNKFWKNRLDPKVYIGLSQVCPYLYLTRLIKQGQDDPMGVSWIKFDTETCPLDSLPYNPTIPRKDADAARKSARLAFAICLYLQTEEGKRAAISTPPRRREGVCPAMGVQCKKRPHYAIRDMLTPILRTIRAESRGGHHASPVAHWRKFHFRSLRHERYHRDAHGNVRVIWVRPTVVNATSATGERKVGHALQTETLASGIDMRTVDGDSGTATQR